MRTWAVCIALGVPVGGAVMLGVPFWLALAAGFVFLFAIIGNGPAKRWGRVALLPVLALAAVLAVHHAAAGATPAGPAVVSFTDGAYSSYGTPVVTVDVSNEGGAAVTLHSVTVRFVNDRAGSVITEVSEPASITVQPGQSQALTWGAPAVVGSAGILDRLVGVTVTGWS